MTTAEVEQTTKKRAVARTEQASPLSAELLEAGTTIADRTVRLARRAAEAGITVSDVVVMGTLGVAEEWAGSTPAAALAVPPVKVAKETWSTTSDGLKELVAAL
jgi:hypothetical protein